MGQIVKSILFGLVWSGIVIFGGVFFYNNITKPFAEDKNQISNWPQVESVVKRSGIDTLVISEGNYKFAHDFIYAYQVNNKAYLGSKIKQLSQFSWSSSTFFINRKIAKYPTGKALTVSFNPDNPNESYIEPTASFLTELIKYLPLILTIPIGILMIIAQIKGVFRTFKNEY